jgi:chromatin remodeling complex protein RSC6
MAPKNSKKTSKSKKTTPPKNVQPEPVPVPEPVQEETQVVEPVAPVDTESSENYDSEFTEIQQQFKDALTLIKSLSAQVSRLEKRVQRDRKVMDKKMKGRAKRVVDPNKPPSGFAKPGPVSDELRKFLSLGKDDLIARTEVTKKITAYCKEHNLQKVEDKRTIHADKDLTKLLRLKKGDELTFFNLQKYMKVHYPNKEGVYPSA